MHKIENIKPKKHDHIWNQKTKDDLGGKSLNKSSIKVRENMNPLYKQVEAP